MRQKKLQLHNPDKLKLILETFAFLDDVRWQDKSNYNLIHYSFDDLTADEQLLTHWLCYITDRQMPYRRIWDIGGYVISHLVRTYSRQTDGDLDDLFAAYVSEIKDKLSMHCLLEGEDGLLQDYGIVGDSVEFRSRYMPEDLTLIYRTLAILDRISSRSFVRYIALAIGQEPDLRCAVRRVAAALDQLTYANARRVSAGTYRDRIKQIKSEVADFSMNRQSNKNLTGKKRLWCSLRDYLKSPEFNSLFVEALVRIGAMNVERWRSSSPALREALDALELPGDVWNNDQIFREALFSPHLSGGGKTWDMPRTIRETYNQLKQVLPLEFYPEQMDVTFSFVPRMCGQLHVCDICIFGGGISKTCHQRAGFLCPVALSACGYLYLCPQDGCRLKDDARQGICGRWQSLQHNWDSASTSAPDS